MPSAEMNAMEKSAKKQFVLFVKTIGKMMLQVVQDI
jgi:hypothetical protein